MGGVRRRVAGVALAVLMVAQVAVADASAERQVVQVTADVLNVRTGPWGTILGQARDGQGFVVSGRRDGWLEISWSGRTAWISGSYARRAVLPAVEPTTSLNARSGPSTSSAVLGVARRGQAYVLLGESGRWRRVQFDGREAWMHGDYLRPALAAPPVAASGGAPAPRLATLLARTTDHARAELALGVRETTGADRDPRIDLYARNAGFAVGQAWCGFFASYCYTQAGRDAGVEFAGRTKLASVSSARGWFLYRTNRDDWTPARVAAWEETRARHLALGDARRYMTLRGSSGDRWASSRGLAHDVYERHQDLPLVPGDFVLFPRHMALVASYEPSTGVLVTIEGNWSDRIARCTYQLSSEQVRARFEAFARPASGDFE